MKTIFLAIGFILVLGIGAALLNAHPQQNRRGPSAASSTRTTSPVISIPLASPSLITINTPTIVTLTVSIPDPTLIQNSVNLIRLGAPGMQPSILGQMHDNGLNGDMRLGDGIFTLQVDFAESIAGQIQLQASAAFRGQLKRVQSKILEFPVWSLATDPALGVTVSFPPTAVKQSTLNDLRIDASSVGSHDREGLSGGEFFVDITLGPLTDDPGWRSHLSNTENIVLSNGASAVRGDRADDFTSPLPGYDMYVVVGSTLYVVAGTYDGSSSSALATIKAIQRSFLPNS